MDMARSNETKDGNCNMNYTDSEIYLLIVASVIVPLGFIIACLTVKPHKSHIWEMMGFIQQQKDKKN